MPRPMPERMSRTARANAPLSRRELFRQTAVGSVAVASAAALGGSVSGVWTAQATPPPARGGHLIVGNEANPNNFDPTRMFGLPPRRIGRTIYNALVSIDEQGNVQPELAESWEQPDDHTYVLRLRQGVTFHDGTPFDAEAVKFHFDRHLNPDVQSLRAGELASVESTTIVDAHTVQIALAQPFAPFLATLFDWSGFVVSPTAVAASGEDYGLNPVGTGPFKFAEHVQDQHTIVERNPDYWEDGLPLLDRITFRPIPIDSTRLTELRSGGVHLIENVPLQDVSRLDGAAEVALSVKDGFRFDYLYFVAANEPYGTNKVFRQAINWAIDREALLLGALFGVGASSFQPFFSGTPYHDPAFQPYHRDLDRAKRLLDESGVSAPIGWQVGVTEDPVQLRVAQIVQTQLAEIGIEMGIEQIDVATQQERSLAGTQTFSTSGWWGWRPDPDQYLTTLMSTDGPNNYARYSDPRVDELLAEGRATSDLDDRIAIYRSLRDIVSDASVYIYYWEGPNIKGLSPSLRGFVHMPDGIVRYHHLWLEQ